MRQQLEKHIAPFSKGMMRKMREIANKLHKTVDPTTSVDNGDSSSIYSIENSSIMEDTGKPAKTVLGKMFGRFKSPLSRL
jgi:hypothetical protein